VLEEDDKIENDRECNETKKRGRKRKWDVMGIGK
jgi:hypothetical protein